MQQQILFYVERRAALRAAVSSVFEVGFFVFFEIGDFSELFQAHPAGIGALWECEQTAALINIILPKCSFTIPNLLLQVFIILNTEFLTYPSNRFE